MNPREGNCNTQVMPYAFAEHDNKRGNRAMNNPLEKLSSTVVMGIVLTVIMVAVLAAIA